MSEIRERIARAICRETCAQVGEAPCFEFEGIWPNEDCHPGCHVLADVVLAEIDAAGCRLTRKPRDINARLRAISGGTMTALEAAVAPERNFDPAPLTAAREDEP